MIEDVIASSEQDRLDVALRLHQEGRIDAAAILYRDILTGSPDHPRALLLLAMALSMARNGRRRTAAAPQADDPAMTYWSPIVSCPPSLMPTSPGPDRETHRLELAMVFFELGKLRQRQGDDRASILLFELATELKPDYAQAFNNIALSLHRIGRRDLALDMIERAVALDPSFIVALRNQGQMLLEQRRPEEACAVFERWVAIEPEFGRWP